MSARLFASTREMNCSGIRNPGRAGDSPAQYGILVERIVEQDTEAYEVYQTIAFLF